MHGSTQGISNNTREIGGDGAYTSQQIRAGLDMHQGYGRFDYDFTDDLHGYLSVAHTLNHSNSTGGFNGETNLTISRNNAYLLQTYRDQLTSSQCHDFQFRQDLYGNSTYESGNVRQADVSQCRPGGSVRRRLQVGH